MNDQAYALRVLADTANRSAYQVHDIAATLAERLHDVKGTRRCRPRANAPGMRCVTRTRADRHRATVE